MILSLIVHTHLPLCWPYSTPSLLTHTPLLYTHHKQNKSVSDTTGKKRERERGRRGWGGGGARGLAGVKERKRGKAMLEERWGEGGWQEERKNTQKAEEKPIAHWGVITYISQVCMCAFKKMKKNVWGSWPVKGKLKKLAEWGRKEGERGEDQ